MKSTNPIGLFDSGIGGTSIWKEIHHLLPFEHTIYLADSVNAPYGSKSEDEIVALSIKNTEILLGLGCKIIVVACNTATTNAIATLRRNYEIPFVGIEPAIKPAALRSGTRSIGILATKGTLNSSLFHRTSEGLDDDISVIEVIGEGLVPIIESGQQDSPEMLALLEKYLQPMIDADVDHLVLGCSHYPYLIPQLKKLLPKHIRIIDSGEAVARQTKTVLEKYEILNSSREAPICTFYSNANMKILQNVLQDHSEEINIVPKDF